MLQSKEGNLDIRIFEKLREVSPVIKALESVFSSSNSRHMSNQLVGSVWVDGTWTFSTQDFINTFGEESLSEAEKMKPEQTVVVEIYNQANLFMSQNEIPIKCSVRVDLLKGMGIKAIYLTYENLIEIGKLETLEEQKAEILKIMVQNLK